MSARRKEIIPYHGLSARFNEIGSLRQYYDSEDKKAI